MNRPLVSALAVSMVASVVAPSAAPLAAQAVPPQKPQPQQKRTGDRIKDKDQAFEPLFDGKSLEGFEQKGGKARYRVDDGCIVGSTVARTPNSFLCTKRHFGDFVLEYEFLVDPTLNSGVQIRSHSLPGYRKGRVHGYQVEIDPSKRAWTAGIYDEARRGWLNNLKDNQPAREAFRQGEWNRVRVVARGDSLKTWLNGVPAADLVDSMTLSGFIGLQVHGVGRREESLEVRWRNLRIRDDGRHEWQPLWDGKSLAGWTPTGGGQWRIEDGALIARNEKSQRKHGLLWFDTPLEDFTVRLKFRAVRGNSGFYFRSVKRDNALGIAGMQAEIEPTTDAGNNTGGIYETGGRGWIHKPAPKLVKRYYRQGQWNQLTVSAHGQRIVVHVNGVRSAELRDAEGRAAGRLALQLHGGEDVEVHFKDIEQLVPARR